MERIVADAVIRPGARADLDAIEALENAAFATDRLSRRSLRYYLGAPSTATVVALEDGTLLGYAMTGFRKGSGAGRLFSLAVATQAARRGIGRALLRACESAARTRGCERMLLEVRTDNAAALALYEREGYGQSARIEDYYEDGGAAFRLGKDLGVTPVP